MKQILLESVLIGFNKIELYMEKNNEKIYYTIYINTNIILTTENKKKAKDLYLQRCHFHVNLLLRWF